MKTLLTQPSRSSTEPRCYKPVANRATPVRPRMSAREAKFRNWPSFARSIWPINLKLKSSGGRFHNCSTFATEWRGAGPHREPLNTIRSDTYNNKQWHVDKYFTCYRFLCYHRGVGLVTLGKTNQLGKNSWYNLGIFVRRFNTERQLIWEKICYSGKD